MKKEIVLFSSLVAVIVLVGAGCVSFGSKTDSGTLGVYRSEDKGESWKTAMAYPTSEGTKSLSGVNVYRLFQDPSDSNTIYLASRGQGLFYTYDNGNSWQSVAKFKSQFIYGVAIDPKNKCVLYVTNGSNIYKSSDCSRNWDLVYTEGRQGERFVGLAVDYADSAVVYGAEYGGDVLVSRDSGQSWRAQKRFSFQLRDVASDPLSPGRVYIASYSKGLARSDDSGNTWQVFADGFKAYSGANNFSRLVLHPNQKDSLFWVSKYGILRSNDAGKTWNPIRLLTPPGSVNIFGFAVSSGDEKSMYYTGTVLGENNEHIRSTFYKTNDGGNNWVTKKLPTNSVPAFLLVQPENNSMIMMGFTNLQTN